MAIKRIKSKNVTERSELKISLKDKKNLNEKDIRDLVIYLAKKDGIIK